MAERFRPWMDPVTGEYVEPKDGLIWWATFGQFQAELQEGVLPHVANMLVFDTENRDKIISNQVLVVGDGPASDEDIAAWSQKAQEIVDSQ